MEFEFMRTIKNSSIIVFFLMCGSASNFILGISQAIVPNTLQTIIQQRLFSAVQLHKKISSRLSEVKRVLAIATGLRNASDATRAAEHTSDLSVVLDFVNESTKMPVKTLEEAIEFLEGFLGYLADALVKQRGIVFQLKALQDMRSAQKVSEPAELSGTHDIELVLP
jgi:hypothetical protein